MKPPARRRVLPARFLSLKKSEPTKKQKTGWLSHHQKNLLDALQHQQGKSDLDFSELQKKMPDCSLFEIKNMIKTLKLNLSSRVFGHVKKLKREEQNAKVPIEIWGELAERMAGVQEETISSAFSQMLAIAGMEPSSLLHSDPPRSLNTPNLKDMHTIPMKPMSISQPGSETSTLNKSNKKNAVSSKEVTSLHTQPISVSSIEPNSEALQSCALSKDSVQPSTSEPSSNLQTSQQCESVSKPTPPASTSNAAISETASHSPHYDNQAKLPEKKTQENNLQNKSVWMKHILDFEKIYQFMSNKTSNPRLTAIESAVLLDLLMTLPEELPLLDCVELQHHLLQIYTHLTTPQTMPKAYQSTANTEHDSDQLAKQETSRTDQHANDTTASPQPHNQQTATELPPNSNDFSKQSSEQILNNDKNNQTFLTDCFQPLNPFLVPVALLKRQ